MYRIRLASGEEAVYRTVQELAQAVASGMVSPDAEVYHKGANRWLPINTHPDYRAAMVTGQQTAINPAIQIPGLPGKAASEANPSSGKNPAVSTSGEPPAKPSGQTSALTSSGQRPSLSVNPVPPAPKLTPPKAPAVPPRKSTTKTTAVPTDFEFDLVDPEEIPPAPANTRQSAAIPIPPARSSTAKASAIAVPPASDLPAEAQIIDLTAPEEPMGEAVGDIIIPGDIGPEVPPARPSSAWFDRGRLVLIASIAALVLAVGVTALVVVKSRPRTQVAIDSTASNPSALNPSDTMDLQEDPPAPTRPKLAPPTTPAPSPVRTARVPSAPEATQPAPKPVVPVAPPRRDSTPRVAVTPAPAPARPRPATNTSRTPSYFQAYADARSEMDESLAYVSFRRVFSPGRFSGSDSLRATKRMVVAAGNILRVYRGREVMLEQQYRPEDPGGRNSLREPFETSEASRALLSDVDSLFALLVNQDGEVTVTEREVRFRSARTAQAYNQIRRQISQTLATWRDSAEASNRVTMPRLVQALGTSLPPVAR
jgi:hypothetical protein